MITTIEQVFHPLLFIMCYILGLNLYPRKQLRSRWIENLNIIYCFIFWFAYIYIFYYVIIPFLFKIPTIYKIKIIYVQPNIFVSIIFVIMSRYHRKRFIICLKKLANVDDSLEELGTPKIYHKFRMWSKRIVIGWLIYSISLNFYESYRWFRKSKTIFWALCMPLLLNYSFYMNILMDLLFISVVWYIGTRFDKVNEHMRYLLVKKGHWQKWEKQVITHHQYVFYTGNYKRILWTLMHIHLELCRLVREVNFIFGIQIIFEIASCFYNLTLICQILSQLIMQEYEDGDISLEYSIYRYFGLSIWLFSYLLKFFTLNYMCENVFLKANQINTIIHELSSIPQFADIWKEIYQFTLQTMSHQLKFTGMGFFYLGNSLLRKLCTTILTFVIIMKQMKIHLFFSDNNNFSSKE